MLNLEPANLAEEIVRAEEFRRKHTARTRDIIRRFAGNWYRLDNNVDPTPDNLVASYVAFMLPELAYSDPATMIQSTRPAEYKQVAEFLEMALDGWMRRARFGEANQMVVQDALMGYGCYKVGLEPVDNDYRGLGISGGPLIPFVSRVPYDQFIMDSRCEHWRDARFLGHVYYRDLTDLESQPDRWDPEAVEQLSSSTDDDIGNMNAGDAERPFGQSATPDRQRVAMADLWIKEAQILITLGRAGKQTLPVVLRNVPYHGPETGPYQVVGMYSVQGDPYPIGPLQFAMEQFEELQAHVGSASNAAKSFKKFVLVDANSKDLAEGLANADNNWVVPVRGLNASQFAEISVGGPNPDVLKYIEYTRDRWDRTIGQGDAQRGQASGKTATESQIVQSNSDGRTAYMKAKVTGATAGVLDKVCWYLIHNPNVVYEVSRTDPITGQVLEGLFLGGIQKGQDGIDWSNFSVEIVADSMARVDDQVIQARALQLVQIGPQLLQMKLTMPALNVDWITDLLGEAMNYKQLSKILFNQAALQQMMVQQQQQAAAAQAQQQGPPGVPGGGPSGGPGGPLMANAGLGFPGGGGAGPGPGNPTFPTNGKGFGRPVSSRSNGPGAGPGASPLPRFGMPQTAGA